MTDQLHPVAAYLPHTGRVRSPPQQPRLAGTVRLTGTASYNEIPYGEEHLPQFIRDAAAGIIQPADNADFAAAYDCSARPFPIKCLIV